MRQQPPTKPDDGTRDTSTRPVTYIALAGIILVALIAVATWGERTFQVKPASGTAQAMALAAQKSDDGATSIQQPR